MAKIKFGKGGVTLEAKVDQVVVPSPKTSGSIPEPVIGHAKSLPSAQELAQEVIKGIKIPEAPKVDLSPIHAGIAAINKRIDAIDQKVDDNIQEVVVPEVKQIPVQSKDLDGKIVMMAHHFNTEIKKQRYINIALGVMLIGSIIVNLI